ncbi:Hint domain-containing protein [Poseidonocella pacifica]|uniref:Hint domain-containing protein n=1 Tax=Poseidonocella pacifica TaxID=871651 RepID=A0A1I0Y7C3_9RHOB|nr:Hint domain-containing protein [Poseidonocella pacifica]SFB08378.1 Hint domain-containing protein [Poseidonocella pacifica]
MQKLILTGVDPERFQYDPAERLVRLKGETFRVFRTSEGLLARSGRTPEAVILAHCATVEGDDGTECRVELARFADGASLFLLSAPLTPGNSYRILDETSQASEWDHGAGEENGPAGLFAGTVLQTPMGQVPVEWLRPGDKVLTRENGYQTVAGIVRSVLSPSELISERRACPVVISPGALDGLHPLSTLRVSAETRVMLRSARAELCFGAHEVLVRAGALVGLEGIVSGLPAEPVALSAVHLEQGDVVSADGWWVASADEDSGYLELHDDEVALVFPRRAFVQGRRAIAS